MKVTFILYLILLSFIIAQAERYAFLTGNNLGNKKDIELKYVRNDIKNFKACLVDLCGFKKENIVTLYNGSPDELKQIINLYKGKLSNENLNDDMFLFYYSGHADNKNFRMNGDNLSYIDFKNSFNTIPTNIRIGIIDACQSGAITRLKGGILDEPFLFKNDKKIKGEVILSSSSANENSQESDIYKNSIFTYHLLNGLKGNSDVSADGKITLNEAYQYAYNKTISTTVSSIGGIQHPGYKFRLEGEDDIVLSEINNGKTILVFGDEIFGKLLVIDSMDRPIIEFYKDINVIRKFSISPGKYKIILRQAENNLEAIITIKETETRMLLKKNFQNNEIFSYKNKGSKENQINNIKTKKKEILKTTKKKKFKLSFKIGGVFYNQYIGDIKTELNKAFNPYSIYNITPEFSFKKLEYDFGIGAEIWYKKFGLEFFYNEFNYKSSKSYNGNKLNNIDNKSYKYILNVEDSLNMDVLRLGFLILPFDGVIKNLQLSLGLRINTLDYIVASTFYDGYYNVNSGGIIYDNGYIGNYYFGLAYIYKLNKYFDICADIVYTYQKELLPLDGYTEFEYYGVEIDPVYGRDNNRRNIEFDYDFSGLEFKTNIIFKIFGR